MKASLKFALLLPMLAVICPLSNLEARNCISRNLGIGGNIRPFETPLVNESVCVDGFLLKVDRVKWSIQTRPASRVAAIFQDENTMIRALRLSSSQGFLNELTSIPATNSNLQLEKIRTTFAVPGIKAIYRGHGNLLSENIQLIRYYFKKRSGQILCFEVIPTGNFPNWSNANSLILDTLERKI